MSTRSNRTMEVYRHEVKYYINKQEAVLLRHSISNFMLIDPYSNENSEYWIRSLYFDTPDNRDYLEKINGNPDRKKIRLRIYNLDEPMVKLEIKNKSGNYIYKETVEIDKLDAIELMNGNSGSLLNYKNKVANKVYAAMHLEHLRPILLLDYEREAYYLPFQNTRITMDKDVRASTAPKNFYTEGIPMVPVFHDDRYILEVKFQTMLPGFVRSILSDIHPQLTSISKYCLSRQAICI